MAYESLKSIKPENNQIAKYKKIVNEYLTKDEIRLLMEKSDLKGLMEILETWSWIVFSFVLVGVFPNVLTVIIALFILGGKQLACAIIMHDTSHYSMFRSKRLNDFFGNWFGAYPIIHNVYQYRPYHLQHHVATGTEDDPDINLTKGYPTTKQSMTRKFLRDLSGATGIKGHIALIAMHLGFLKYSLGNYIERITVHERGYLIKNGLKNLSGPLISNLILFGICYAFGKPMLYLLWPAALLTTNQFSLRVRAIAEHSVVEDTADPMKNTRTTYANFIEKLLFAPHHVNYHLEHHFLIPAPSYNYPKMHKILKERGFYEKGLLKNGYVDIVKMTIKK